MTMQYGNILRDKRKKKKLTLTELAQKTGLSVSYLSLLERGINSPTVESLNKVCTALDLTLSDLIAKASKPKKIVTKADQRRTIFSSDGFLYEAASENANRMNCIVMTIKDMHTHISTPHVADEMGYIVSGSIFMTVDGIDYKLDEGDCIFIEAHRPHSYCKTSEEDCVSVWVYDKHLNFSVAQGSDATLEEK